MYIPHEVVFLWLQKVFSPLFFYFFVHKKYNRFLLLELFLNIYEDCLTGRTQPCCWPTSRFIEKIAGVTMADHIPTLFLQVSFKIAFVRFFKESNLLAFYY